MEPHEFTVQRDVPGGGSVTLAGETLGEGPPLVLLHGLTATRRNVVQGSRALPRKGYRLISYDARGHGQSSRAPSSDAYEYRDLVEDLEAVLDHFSLDQVPLIGSSMGAATAMAFALEKPERVRALVQITPAYAGEARTGAVPENYWTRMADELEHGGVDAFVEVAEPGELPERWREIAREATRQRMERNADLHAVADALRVLPRSLAWRGMEPLEALDVPVMIVATRDDADQLHPFAIAEEYARRLPQAELVVEDEGQSPLAWQGARLSGEIAAFLGRIGYS